MRTKEGYPVFWRDLNVPMSRFAHCLIQIGAWWDGAKEAHDRWLKEQKKDSIREIIS